jgi:hypothetical protein
VLGDIGWGEVVAFEGELRDTMATQPSGAGVHGSKKASVGSSGSKGVLYTKEDLEAMGVEEKAIALSCGFKGEVRFPSSLARTCSVEKGRPLTFRSSFPLPIQSLFSWQSVKHIRLEAEGLRTHYHGRD